MSNEQDKHLLKALTVMINIIVFLLLFILALLALLIYYMPEHTFSKTKLSPATFSEEGNITSQNTNSDTTTYWKPAPEESLEKEVNKELVLYGKDIIVHTSDYYGTGGKVFKSSTNGMNCQNCHLEAGTKTFGNNYSAVASTYPKLRARSGSVETIYKRVNDCFERSLNGKPIDTASKEMLALEAYIKWLGKEVPKGNIPQGSGLKKIAALDRAADRENGKIIYSQKCASCHQQNGMGLMNGDKTAYTYPPLWGPGSYNDGAGLFRLSNFASYIKYNMPLGVNYASAQLSDEEAWDIAAYVNSQPRPVKNKKADWPNILQKPFDHPFGPYADGFSEEQHKYGPYKPIQEKLASLTKH